MRRLPFFLLLLIFAFSSLSCLPNKISDDEKNLLFTYKNWSEYTGTSFKGIDTCETFSKISFLNFINQYHYSFDSSKESSNSGYLYLNSDLSYYPSVATAISSLQTEYNAIKIGFKIAGKKIRLKENNNFFTLGDENYQSFIMHQDSIMGNLIITRIGKKVLQILMIGQYFDEQELLEECVQGTINAINDDEGVRK